ncbi:MAG: membrane protein insertase YidC [Opitutaceae bacterium]|nr:membrane protein insertase YidC [Opitutaceae bacterium]
MRDVAFKKYPAAKDTPGVPFVFNKARAAPILALDIPGADPSVRHERVSASASEVVYRAVIRDANGAPLVEVTRRYSLTTAGADDPRDGKNDPYRIRHETTFRNLSAQPQHAFPSLNIGTTALLSTGDSGQFLNIAHFDGDKPRIINRGDLEGGGFMTLFGAHNPPKAFVEAAGSIEWGAAKNQFFAAIYTPDQPAAAIVARRISLPPLVPGSLQENIGMTASLRLNPVAIPSGENAAVTLGGYLYAGPKEYVRLAKFPKAEDKVMEFDSSFYNRVTLSGYIAPVMSMLMVWMHGFTDNWGLAVVCMTLLLKFICVPFTLAASRSAKRMQKLQPAMKELREKYKDAPQKLNQATMQLFKDNKVNPLGGCLPVFITIPLFIAFFWMLQGTAELRFQSFLWNHDLSAPDTVFRLWGIPLNIMPLLMGATMIIQMRLTPQPSVDNAQARIFKWMPVFFTFICYNFSAALALYSTVNGLFTIGQQLVVNKLTRDEPANLSHVPGHGKPARPSKKHRR